MSISLALSPTGAIPDRDTLITAVQDWLDRDDLNDKIPMFIQMAEALFNRELRTPQMEATSIGSASGEDIPLPEDYLAMRAIYEEGSPDRPLRGIAPTAIRQGFDGTTGTPVAYTLVSGGIRLVPPPSSAITLTMDYFARIYPLTVSSPTNWLLEQHPDAYLYATLYNAEIYLDNIPRAAQWKGQLDEIVGRLNRTSRNDRYGAGPLVPNTIGQVRGVRN
jgi:hypothetical protein